jgi:phage anti-repressor protein
MEPVRECISTLVAQYSDKISSQFVNEFMFSLESSEKICIPAEKLLDWKVFKNKQDIRKRLTKLYCILGVDFTETCLESTGGRPSKKITLTVDCFKQLCMMACNSEGKQVREYYLILEKLFKKYTEDEFKRQMDEKNAAIDTLKTNLTQEQKSSINIQKSLIAMQKKFTHRYKFDVRPCIYILEDPDCKYAKYKIGITKDMNDRLKTDRTMVPSIKVRAIFYTPFNELFEKCIKVRYREQLEQPSHEWVFEPLERLIETYKEIDRSCYFSSIIESNLWRYNMEDPPSEGCEDPEPISAPPVYRKKRSPANIPKTQNTMDEELSHILPTRVLRHEYRLKTKEAPEGYRYCNGFCQVYQPTISFTMRSNYLLTLCTGCERMADVAKVRLETGTVTEEEIRGDPSILKIAEDEMVCRKCSKVLKKTDFPEKRRQCSKCRDANRSKHGAKFDDKVGSEVEILKTLSEGDVCLKLGTYVKTELQKIMTFVGVGRKYNDNKGSMIEKLRDHFHVSEQLI